MSDLHLSLNRLRPAAILSLLAVSLLGSSAQAFECNKPIDSTKAVIFIDTNFGLREIHTAEEAACNRGERFIRFPAPIEGEEEAHQSLVRLSIVKSRIENLRAQAKSIGCTLPSTSPEASVPLTEDSDHRSPSDLSDDSRCRNMIQTFHSLGTEADSLSITVEAFVKKVKDTNGGANFVYSMVENGMKDLAQKGIRPSALILSGHSGGTSMAGRYDGISLVSVQKYVVSAYANAPHLLADLKSIYLWGCNTLNPYAPEKWTKVFPSVDLIAGFQGSAPSNLNSSSWSILSGLLNQESSLLARAATFTVGEDVKNAFDRIPGISETVTATYLHDRASDRKWFFESMRDTTGENGSKWITRATELLSAKDCAPVANQIREDQAYIEDILSGLVPISEYTSGGKLREVYTRARRNDFCRATLGYAHDADRIGLLLFWHGVKKNAVRALMREGEKLTSLLDRTLSDPQEFMTAIEEMNRENQRDFTTRKQEYEAGKASAQKKLDYAQAQLSKFAAADALLPWTKKRRSELKRLTRREKALKRKLSRKGDSVRDALSTVQQDIANYVEAKRRSTVNRQAETDSFQDVVETYEILLSRYEKDLTNLSGSPLRLDADSLLEDLRTIAANLHPRNLMEIESMGYAEARRFHLARQAALDRIENAASSSSQLMLKLGSLRTTARSWHVRFEQTAILPKTECMDFLAWHEYLGGAGSAGPQFVCHYSL